MIRVNIQQLPSPGPKLRGEGRSSPVEHMIGPSFNPCWHRQLKVLRWMEMRPKEAHCQPARATLTLEAQCSDFGFLHLYDPS